VINFWLKSDTNYSVELTIFIQPMLYKEFSILVNDKPLILRLVKKRIEDSTKHQKLQIRFSIPKKILKNDEHTKFTFKMTTPKSRIKLKCFQKWKDEQFIYNCRRGHFACYQICING